MWDIPRYRIRAYVRAKRRAQLAKKEANRRELHFRRAAGEIRLADSSVQPIIPSEVTIILNELTPVGLYFFSKEPLTAGQRINLTVQMPRLFFVRGKVVDCQRISQDSKIIRKNPLNFRVLVEFEYQSLYEKEQVRAHLRELNAELYPNRRYSVSAA